MNSLVSAVSLASATAIPASAIASPDDPIFALIERHKVAFSAFSEALSAQSDTEETIERSRRNSTIHCEEVEVVAGDDPRWIDALHGSAAATAAMNNAATVLVDVAPSSIAGASALLRYIIQHIETYGEPIGFPDEFAEDGVDPDNCKFNELRNPEFFIMRNAAACLERLVSPASSTAANIPTLAYELEIEQVVAELEKANEQHERALRVYGDAEEHVFAWQRANPKPEMRRTTVGEIDWPEDRPIEYGTESYFEYQKLVDEANADISAAIGEHSKAFSAWSLKRKEVQAKYRYLEVRAAEHLAGDAVGALANRLGELPVRTVRDMKLKATWAEKLGDSDLAWSLVDDLLNKSPAAPA